MKTTLLPSLLLIAIIGILTSLIAGFVGYTAGRDIGTALAYDASFDVGYAEAFNSNKSDGYSIGYNEGISQGILQGASQVNNNQIDRARSEGFTDGRQSGYNDGYFTGFASGNRVGIKTALDNFLQNRRPEIRRELERESYICSSTNICERTISNDTSTGRREWSVFNLSTMNHSMNVEWTTDTGEKRKQRVNVDYNAGTLTLETSLRTSNYTTPLLVYNFQSSSLTTNNSNDSDQEQTELLMSWYTGSANAKSIGDNAGITWVLSANRG